MPNNLVTLPAEVQALWLGSLPLAGVHIAALEISALPPLPDIAFPAAIFDVYGVAWDPYDPGLRTTATGSTVPALGDAVGRVPWLGNPVDYAGTARDPVMTQATSGNRPALVEVDGRRGFAFDGVSDRLEAPWVARFEPPMAFTAFAMLHLDGGSDRNPLGFARAEVSNSFLKPFRIAGAILTYNTTMRHSATGFIAGMDAGATYSVPGWKCLIMEYELSAFAAGGGVCRLEENGLERYALTVTPTTPGTADVTTFTRATIGARRTGSTVQGFFTGTVGRCGSISRLLDPGREGDAAAVAEGDHLRRALSRGV